MSHDHLPVEKCLAYKKAGFPQELEFGDKFYPSFSIAGVIPTALYSGHEPEDDYVRIPTLEELLAWVDNQCRKKLNKYAEVKILTYNGRYTAQIHTLTTVYCAVGEDGFWYQSPLSALYAACVKAGIVEE